MGEPSQTSMLHKTPPARWGLHPQSEIMVHMSSEANTESNLPAFDQCLPLPSRFPFPRTSGRAHIMVGDSGVCFVAPCPTVPFLWHNGPGLVMWPHNPWSMDPTLPLPIQYPIYRRVSRRSLPRSRIHPPAALFEGENIPTTSRPISKGAAPPTVATSASRGILSGSALEHPSRPSGLSGSVVVTRRRRAYDACTTRAARNSGALPSNSSLSPIRALTDQNNLLAFSF